MEITKSTTLERTAVEMEFMLVCSLTVLARRRRLPEPMSSTATTVFRSQLNLWSKRVSLNGFLERRGPSFQVTFLPLTIFLACISCLYTNGNNNNNNNNGNYVSQNCAKMYEQSTKCESKVTATSYQDNSGCELIHDVVPKMSSALKGGSGNAAKVFAWLFAVTIVAMGFYIYRLHKMLIRPNTVDTSELVGTTA